MKMGLADASNKDKMDKTIYQSDYFTGYGVKDWDSILSGLRTISAGVSAIWIGY